MTNDELMTKSKTPREQFDEGFWNDDAGPVIREEPSDMNDDVPITNSQGMALVIRASSLVCHSSFVIRHFPVRHSNHAR